MSTYTYFLKYAGCDEEGRLHIEVSWNGDDADYPYWEPLCDSIYGLRGFSKDERPTFTWLEDVLVDGVLDVPPLADIIGQPRDAETTWNAPDACDYVLRRVVTNLHAIKVKSHHKPIFAPSENEPQS